jgi:hypothetical protein
LQRLAELFPMQAAEGRPAEVHSWLAGGYAQASSVGPSLLLQFILELAGRPPKSAAALPRHSRLLAAAVHFPIRQTRREPLVLGRRIGRPRSAKATPDESAGGGEVSFYRSSESFQ